MTTDNVKLPRILPPLPACAHTEAADTSKIDADAPALVNVDRIEARPGVTAVDLWYPDAQGEPTVVEIQLVHVRAARDIRVQYDFDRDGYVVSAPDTDGYDPYVDARDERYVEVAFVPAWSDGSTPST